MKRRLRARRLFPLLTLALLFFTPLLHASSVSNSSLNTAASEDAPLEIRYSDQTIVTATRSVQSIRRVTDNVTVISREELDRWPVGDLDEALGLVTGIVVQDDGHIGQTATAQIYGSKDRHARVLVDGITFNATTTSGRADLSQIPLDIVEKIEIVKGAASSVWGSSLGGAIQVITRPVGNSLIPKVNGTLSFGEFSTQRERGEISGRAGPLRYFGFGSYVESGGFRPNSDVLEKRVFLKGELPLTDDFTAKGSFGYSGSKTGEFDLPSVGLVQDRQVLQRYGSAGAEYEWGDRIHFDAVYKISERSFRRSQRLLPARTDFRLSRARSLIHEVSLQSVIDWDEHQTFVAGADIGVDVYQPARDQFGTVQFTVNKNDTRHAYYGNYQVSWRFLDGTIGSRADFTNAFGTNFDPSAGFAVHLPFWRSVVRANVSRAFNEPSFDDRFLSLGRLVANADLKAEHAVVYNIGFEAEPFPKIHGKAVFFQAFVDDSIQTITRTDGLRQPVNLKEERRTGFETEAKLGPWLGFSFLYGVAFVRAVDSGGVLLQSRPQLTHDVKVNFRKEFWKTVLNAHLAGRHMDLVTYAEDGFTDPIDQLFLFDGKTVLTFPEVFQTKVSVFLKGENLLNQDFGFDGSRDPAPQRNFEAGFKVSFEV